MPSPCKLSMGILRYIRMYGCAIRPSGCIPLCARRGSRINGLIRRTGQGRPYLSSTDKARRDWCHAKRAFVLLVQFRQPDLPPRSGMFREFLMQHKHQPWLTKVSRGNPMRWYERLGYVSRVIPGYPKRDPRGR